MNQNLSLWAGTLAAVFVVSPVAVGQLTPERTYFGTGKPLTLVAKVPEGKSGPLSITLYPPTASGGQPVKATVEAGSVDLAVAFPKFWEQHASKLWYAQLGVGEEGVGAPVVLQPLRNPPMAALDQNTQQIRWQGGQGPVSGVRAYVDQHMVFETSKGEIEFRFRPDEAPNTVWHIRSLAQGGFYTDIPFHRIMGPNNGRPGFMAQGGDPTGTGTGGPGVNIDLEPSRLPHDFGVISMARTGHPDTGGSQFFVCFSRAGTQMLDGGYCAFGQAVRGGETIVALEATEVQASPGGERSKPIDPPMIRRARLVDAPPFGKAPAPVTRPETGSAGGKPEATPEGKPAGK